MHCYMGGRHPIGPQPDVHNDKFAEGNLGPFEDSIKDFVNFTTSIKRNKKTVMEI